MRPALGLILSLWATVAGAQETLKIAVISLNPDPRYDEAMAYARIETNQASDPLTAAELALADMGMLLDTAGLTVELRSITAADLEGVSAAAAQFTVQGGRYLILDLPADEVDAVVSALGPEGPLSINATAAEDWLRRRCHPRLLHTAASDRMTSDALIQHFVKQRWNRVLVLHGKTSRDLARAESFIEAASRFRLRIADQRTFDLSTNPALREQNNIALLTGNLRDYDVVFVADSFGEYSRYLPFQTALPRPVVGATGLVPLEWHWSLERYGAPQVNSRFENRQELVQRMSWQDWSVWIATRAVLTAEAKSRDRGPAAIETFLRSPDLRLDGSKGAQLSFRSWDGQLRQPILLATTNAVIAIAPLEGYLHRTNTLDSLGVDEPEFSCD